MRSERAAVFFYDRRAAVFLGINIARIVWKMKQLSRHPWNGKYFMKMDYKNIKSMNLWLLENHKSAYIGNQQQINKGISSE